eukprot:COSAG06_NODE_2217_length_7324_cov_7.546298_9_plen_79_part_00
MVCAVVELDCPRPWPVTRADAGDDAVVPAWGNDDLAPGAWTSILVNIPEFIAPLRLNVLSDVELFLTCDLSVLPQHAL